MGFWKTLFSIFKSASANRTAGSSTHTRIRKFRERDNAGTRHETAESLTAYGILQRQYGHQVPFVNYHFLSKDDAISAVTELPCFGIATDSGKLICTDVLEYGLIPNLSDDGSGEIASWSVCIAGKSMSLELYEAAIASFKKHYGKGYETNCPAKTTSAAVTPTHANTKAVEFVREKKNHGSSPGATSCHYKTILQSA